MQKRIIVLTTLALVALLATTALAERPGRGTRADCHGGGYGQGPHSGRLLSRLDLTEDQETAIAALHDQARTQGLELRKQLARLRNERQGEMLKDQPSEKTLIQLTEQMGQVQTRLKVIQVKTRLAVRALLTEEQRDQMMLMKAQGRSGRADARGRHGRHGRGQYPGRAPVVDDED